MPILKFKKLTRSEYDALSLLDNNTRYTVVENDNTITEYLGATPYSSNTGGGGDVNLYTDAEMNDTEKVDNGNIKITGYLYGIVDGNQW